MRVLIRQILGAVAQWERAVIRKRLAAGRAEKARQGGYAYGSPPFGWSAKDRELVRNQAERAIANRMRSMRANGASLRQIADTLNAERVPAKRGGRWHPETIKQALSR